MLHVLLDLCYTYPARHILTAGYDIDDLDHDLIYLDVLDRDLADVERFSIP